MELLQHAATALEAPLRPTERTALLPTLRRIRSAIDAHELAEVHAQDARASAAARALEQTPLGRRAAECECVAGVVSLMVTVLVPLVVVLALLDTLGDSRDGLKMLMGLALATGFLAFLLVNRLFAVWVTKLRRAAQETHAHAD